MIPSSLRFALRRAGGHAAHRYRFQRALSSLPDHKVITMPALSPTMEVGTIQEWKKKVGDPIEGGDVIAEIETDKATRSYEYNDDGYLARVSSARSLRFAPILRRKLHSTAALSCSCLVLHNTILTLPCSFSFT